MWKNVMIQLHFVMSINKQSWINVLFHIMIFEIVSIYLVFHVKYGKLGKLLSIIIHHNIKLFYEMKLLSILNAWFEI